MPPSSCIDTANGNRSVPGRRMACLLGEVLVASFFLQLFALVSPLFFQVVIDKVLVHRALSTLDERVIQQNMNEIAKGRTVLVIAHRLSTVRAMDRIVTLERGRLVEDGTHDALIKTGGRYASLHRLQAGIHEVR
jgi:ABC-type bacteriocin/lantibiotic exporter with double-glycine peptidase domain